MSKNPWIEKLDETLRQLVSVKVDCLVVLTDPTGQGQQEVAALIETHGGNIHTRMTVVLAACVPLGALHVLASSEHVMHVQAEGTMQVLSNNS